jgi:uncharacterized protein (TIGR03066 family)
MLSAIGKTCALAVLAAGLSASAMTDVAEARGFGGGHGGGFHHGGGGGHHSFHNFNGNRGRTIIHHSPSQNFRRSVVTPRKTAVRHGVRSGFGRTRIAAGRRIAGRRHFVQRWRNRLRWRHHRWGIGRRHWRHLYFGFDFAMSGDDGYTNPYCGNEDGGDGGEAGGDASSCYDYNQPVTGDSRTTDAGVDQISQADEAFNKGDYETALKMADKAVKEMPQNADLHQFRSLVFFAMKRYRESAMAAHAALVGGKGWNWETLRGFYASKDAYTAQLRGLEGFVHDNPANAAARFLLGYHYMMLGHGDAAGSQMATVVKLEPRDKLAAKMLAAVSQKTGKQYAAVAVENGIRPIESAGANAGPSILPLDEDPSQPATTPSGDVPAAPSRATTPAPKSAAATTTAFNIVGNWKAAPEGSVITLSFTKDGKFRWSAKDGGESFNIDGTYKLVKDQLSLTSPKEKQPLEGTLTVKGGNEFELKLKDAEKDEPALTFKRQ